MDIQYICSTYYNPPSPAKIKQFLSQAAEYRRRYQIILNHYKERYKNFLKLCLDSCHAVRERDDDMVNNKFLEFLITDIIATEEYTLDGIAHYLRISTDAMIDIVAGINRFPSYHIVFKLLELHFSVKPSDYQ